MMKGSDLLRIVDQMHHENNIPREIIFEGIEAAVQLATEKHYGELEPIVVNIDRDTGEIKARRADEEIGASLLGRIAAQAAKQAMIQKIREAEGNDLFNEYAAMKRDLVHGSVQRHEGGAAIVSLGKTEAILPRGEQIPGETHHVGERIKAVILDVKKGGHRVKIILSRTHPDFVRRLFENEIPEIADRTIEIKALAREAGYRAKVAVSSIDLKVDCVGACVGVRGSRIKNVVDELGGERIDIVRWNDSMQVLIPNALQPAQIEEVHLYPRLGRAIVLVKEDQFSLAIARRGQNVRLASKLTGWDIELMTVDELNERIDMVGGWFSELPHVTDELVETFVTEGFLSFDDLTFLEPAQLGELAGLTEEQAAEIIDYAEEAAERVEQEAKEAKEAEAEARAAGTFVEPTPTPGAAGGPRLEDLSGDVVATPAEQSISTAHLLGDPPPSLPVAHPTPPTGPAEPVMVKPTPEDEPDKSVGPTQAPEESGPTLRREQTVLRVVRDNDITRRVKELHEFYCQVCGHRLEFRKGEYYAEGAHIQPLGGHHKGPDKEKNVLCLCPNHHVLFDKGAFSINGDMTFLIWDGLTRDGLGLVGKCRTVPEHTIEPECLRYHREHVFGRGS